MRIFSLLTLLCICFVLQAKSIKINYKNQVRPFTIKIEKIDITDSGAVVYAAVKQQQNFSYGISFSDYYIKTPLNSEPVKGTLQTWNNEKKVWSESKPMSDNKEEKFTLFFPIQNLSDAESFDIKIGNIEDRKKTELFFKDIPIKK